MHPHDAGQMQSLLDTLHQILSTLVTIDDGRSLRATISDLPRQQITHENPLHTHGHEDSQEVRHPNSAPIERRETHLDP